MGRLKSKMGESVKHKRKVGKKQILLMPSWHPVNKCVSLPENVCTGTLPLSHPGVLSYVNQV